MIIGFDGQNAVYNNKRRVDFSRMVLDKLSLHQPDNSYIIYTPDVIDNAYLASLITRSNVKLKHRHHRLSAFMWRSVNGVLHNMRRHRVQVYHGLCGQVPLKINSSGVPSVVTFKSTAFLSNNYKMGGFKRMLKKYMAKKSCKNAQCITTLTQSMKQCLVDNLNIDGDRIIVVPPAISDQYCRLSEGMLNEAMHHYGITRDQFVLVSCSTMADDYLTIMKAIAHCEGKPLDMLLMGRCSKFVAHELKKHKEECNFKGNIYNISRSHHSRLAAITSLARACVITGDNHKFPNVASGAQFLGIPVITSNQFADVVGDGAMVLDLCNEQQLTEALSLVNSNEVARNAIIERGKENAKQFDGEIMAQRYVDIYKSLLNK